MELLKEQVTELIEYLQGSCKTINEACNEVFEKGEEILSENDLEQIDSEIFECSTCGWWFECAEEGSDGGVCQSCCGEDEDE